MTSRTPGSGDPQFSESAIPQEIRQNLETIQGIFNYTKKHDWNAAVFRRRILVDPSLKEGIPVIRKSIAENDEYKDFIFSNLGLDAIQGMFDKEDDAEKMMLIIFSESEAREHADILTAYFKLANLLEIPPDERSLNPAEALEKVVKPSWTHTIARLYREYLEKRLATKSTGDTARLSFEEEKGLSIKQRYDRVLEERSTEPLIIAQWRALAKWASDDNPTVTPEAFGRTRGFRGDIPPETRNDDAPLLSIKKQLELPTAEERVIAILSATYEQILERKGKNPGKTLDDIVSDIIAEIPRFPETLESIQKNFSSSRGIAGDMYQVIAEGCLRGIYDPAIAMHIMYGEAGKEKSALLSSIRKFADSANVPPEVRRFSRGAIFSTILEPAWNARVARAYEATRRPSEKLTYEQEKQMTPLDFYLHRRKTTGGLAPIVHEWKTLADWSKLSRGEQQFDLEEYAEAHPAPVKTEGASGEKTDQHNADIAPPAVLHAMKLMSALYEVLASGKLTWEKIRGNKEYSGTIKHLQSLMKQDTGHAGDIFKIVAEGCIREIFDPEKMMSILKPPYIRDKKVHLLKQIVKFGTIAGVPPEQRRYWRKWVLDAIVKAAWKKKIAQLYHESHSVSFEEKSFEELKTLTPLERSEYRAQKERRENLTLKEWMELAEWTAPGDETFNLEEFIKKNPYQNA